MLQVSRAYPSTPHSWALLQKILCLPDIYASVPDDFATAPDDHAAAGVDDHASAPNGLSSEHRTVGNGWSTRAPHGTTLFRQSPFVCSLVWVLHISLRAGDCFYDKTQFVCTGVS